MWESRNGFAVNVTNIVYREVIIGGWLARINSAVFIYYF